MSGVKKIRTKIDIVKAFFNDAILYLKYSSTFQDSSQSTRMEYEIISHTHVIEKGLSMPDPKLGFGKEIIKKLILLLRSIKSDKDIEKDPIVISAKNCVRSYINFHERNDFPVEKIKAEFQKISSSQDEHEATLEIKKDEILALSRGDFLDMSKSRHSIREFSSQHVDKHLLKQAVKMAQRAPSTCNRQSSRAHVFQNENDIKKILSYHKGHRGFGHLIKTLIIVTSDTGLFYGAKERHQPYIDGGIFSMALLYSLHYLGLGACALNWCVSFSDDIGLKKNIHISPNENVILIIAVGHYKDRCRVPASGRKNLEDIFKYKN